MKDGVILRVSKPARMGIDDAPLYPPAATNCRPSSTLAVFCGIK